MIYFGLQSVFWRSMYGMHQRQMGLDGYRLVLIEPLPPAIKNGHSPLTRIVQQYSPYFRFDMASHSSKAKAIFMSMTFACAPA